MLKLKEWHILTSIFAVSMAIILGTLFYSSASKPPPITADSALIERSKELSEVMIFLERYPNAISHVERGSDIVVTHSTSITRSEDREYDSHLYLRIILSRDGNNVQQISFVCRGGEPVYNATSGGTRHEIFKQVHNEVVLAFLNTNEDRTCFN